MQTSDSRKRQAEATEADHTADHERAGLSEDERAKIADGCLTCEGTGLAVSRYDRDGNPTEFELCDFCGVKAASEVLAARMADLREQIAGEIEAQGRGAVEWLAAHRVDDKDMGRLIGTEDAYKDAIRIVRELADWYDAQPNWREWRIGASIRKALSDPAPQAESGDE